MKVSVIAAVLFCILSCVLGAQWIALELQTRSAAEQVRVFSECRRKALLLSTEEEVRDLLQYVRAYYPSGSKLREGSTLDALVEDVRLLAITDTNARLEARAGRDGGGNPDDGSAKLRP
jgi:uncharacterized protein YlxW (UPF0749 family)